MWKKLKSALSPTKPPELTTLFSAPNPGQLTDYQKAFHAPPTSYAEQFPDVPAPKPATLQELIASRWVAGEVRPEQMPGIAADLLEAGFDTPSLRRLAGEMHARCLADVQELVVKMLNELGITVPDSETEARVLATRQIAREVIAGKRSPWNASTKLAQIWGYEIWHLEHLADIAQLLDALDCPSITRGELPELTSDLVEIYAKVGARTAAERRMHGFGALQGQGWIADDFNDPLPDYLQALFEGRDDPE